MRNLKYLFLSFGFLLIILGGINFYNQNHPPRIPFLCNLYKFFHGDIIIWSNWTRSNIDYNSSKIHNGYYYLLRSIEFGYTETVFHFYVSKYTDENVDDPDQQEIKKETREPFPNPVMKVVNQHSQDNVYCATKKEIKEDDAGNLIVDLYYPEVLGSYGDIMFWCAYKTYSGDYDRLFWFSPPSNYEPISGTNIWGILFFIGIITFLISAKINPIKSINKQIIKSADELDNAKKRSIERVSDGKLYEKLSLSDKYRYDTITDYYNKAQSIIFESYNLYSRKAFFSFEIFFKSIIIIIIIMLFASILFSGIKIFAPEIMKLFRLTKPTIGYGEVSHLNYRLSELENARFSLTLILSGLLGLGIFSIIATYTINVWKVRAVTRSLIEKKIKKINTKMRLEIENKTGLIDTKLISIGNKIGSVEETITIGIYNTDKIADKSKKQFKKKYDEEKKNLNKQLKMSNKQFQSNVKKIRS